MPRLPVPSFTEDDNGNLFVADGNSNMQRWDGVASAFVDAGLTAPPDALTVASSTEGTIVGTIYGYQRFVDVDGRVSNMSPISSAHSISTNTGSVEDATNAAPIVITSTTHGLTNGETVKIEGVIGNRGANGTWVVANKTDDTFELADSQGTGDYAAGGTWNQGAGQIDYSGFTDASADTRIVTRQILRNKDGNVNVFYVDVELTDLTLTSTSSTNEEDDLGTEVPLLDANGRDLALTRHGEPPDHKKVIVNHYTRMFAAVDNVETQGCVAVTNGSATVTGIRTNFQSGPHDDWLLYVDDSTSTSAYEVSSISGQTITLGSNFAGATDPYANYTLRPARSEALTIWFSEAGLPDSFDALKPITLSSDPEAGDMVGLMPIESRLYILFENRIYKLSYVTDPSVDGDSVISEWRGCLNQNCWQIVERDAYLMDRHGVYKFDGDSYEVLSLPVQPLFEKQSLFSYAINFERTEHFHASHDARNETIRWFVCIGSHRYPRHALCYHYRVQRWWIEEFPVPITCSRLGDLGGNRQVFYGTSSRRILAGSRSSLDGIDPNSLVGRGTVTSSTRLSITDSSAAFDSSMVGLPVVIAEGTGVGQIRTVVAQTATVLTVKDPWLTKPDTTSVYQVGGIQWKYTTGWFRFVQTAMDETRGFELIMEPTEDSATVRMRRFYDQSASPFSQLRTVTSAKGNKVAATKDSPYLYFDTTKATGFFKRDEDAYRAPDTDGVRYIRYELTGVSNSKRQSIHQLNLQGVQK